jgi:chemotaxis signal transduction protein
MNANDPKTNDRHCIFGAAGSTFAVSALSVCEIAERPPLVSVPDAPDVLAGLCHFRNEFLPVLDLGHFVGTASSDSKAAGFILVLTGHDGRWALLIDRGLALEPLEIAYASADGASSVLVGTASFREDVVQVVDAEMLYHRAASLLEGNWQGNGRVHAHAATTH